MLDSLPPAWKARIEPLMGGEKLDRLEAWLDGEEAAGRTIYPKRENRFRAFELTAPEAVRAVILGQDPYHGPGQAHGLAFSVPYGEKPPPSLRNIFRELTDDLGVPPPLHGNLESWARQGVLLLNTSLSVEEGKAGSHAGQGWETLTDAAVAAVASGAPSAFILWGAQAQKKVAQVPRLEGGDHLVLASPHPSPLSAHRGFFGSRPFSRANAFLERHGRGAIDWSL